MSRNRSETRTPYREPANAPSPGCRAAQAEHQQTPAKSRSNIEFHCDTSQASEMLKALSHEARLSILCLLAHGEASVSTLEAFSQLPQATVSQHLARLRSERIVTSRRDGRKVFYRISNSRATEIVRLLAQLYQREKPADTKAEVARRNADLFG